MNGFNLSDITYAKLGVTTLGSIYLGSTKLWPRDTSFDYSREYFTIESLADNNTISFKKSGSAPTVTIYWSSDKTTWNSVSTADSDTALKILSKNEKIYIKGNNNNYGVSSYYNHFTSDGDYNISGNIMSLIYGDDFIGKTTLPSATYIFYDIFTNSKLVDASNLILPAKTLQKYCYYCMFQDCTSLTTAPELPATTLADSCYERMFVGCTSLTVAPTVLPATTLTESCYTYMFSRCTSLTTAPEIHATTLARYCCSNMFGSCKSLTTAPELPATTLADYCYYNMFGSCTSLTTAPELPATTVKNSCYKTMFYNCTSLTTAPKILPATTLIMQCYYQMFRYCSNLTAAPELPATTLVSQCYTQMFDNCKKLSSIKCLATDISASMCITSWVSGVAGLGIFTKSQSMTNWTTGIDGIPSGWTVEDI